MAKYILIFLIFFLSACVDSVGFWYPIKALDVICGSFQGEVYDMTHSYSWRSYPYYLEIATTKEIVLGTDCIIRTGYDLPKHKLHITSTIRARLSQEQRQYIVEGF